VNGYEVQPEEVSQQVAALASIGERTTGLVGSASRLAEHLPRLGTAPPALHLAMRLREAAGQSGVTGEISAVDSELNSYHRALRATVTSYLDTESGNARTFQAADGDRA
jgi:hypothetical protein